MRKQWIILVLIITISIVLGCVEKQPAAPTPTPTPKVTPAENLIPLHLNAASISSDKCKGCHDVLKETSLKADIKPPHVVHLTSPLLKFECNTCHKSVDLNEKSSAAVRKQVDPDFCAKCHSPFSTKMDPANKNKDCTMCHSNYKVKMEAKGVNAFVNLDSITTTDCLKCHGDAPWYIGGNTS